MKPATSPRGADWEKAIDDYFAAHLDELLSMYLRKRITLPDGTSGSPRNSPSTIPRACGPYSCGGSDACSAAGAKSSAE
jgi:hypothetical protein